MSTDPLRFGTYRVIQRGDGSPWQLGIGAMGITYKAFDERLQMEVALKVIAPGLLHDPAIQAMFLREARTAARVRHTHVASILTLDDTPGSLFYAMEFVPGQTLQAFIRRHVRLPQNLAVELARQAALGLEAIHRQSLVHRDLKPSNLMLTRTSGTSGDGPEAWELKVIDFGIARMVVTDADATRTQGFRGTVLYASPEQCLERPEVDGRSDLYSLGCILCEMLLGRPPFLAKSQHELMARQISAPVAPELLARLPEPLQPLLAQLLEKEPADRPAQAGAVARALAPLVAMLPGTPLPEAPATSTGEVGAHVGGTTRAASPTAREATQRSVAVLAFENLSAERENEYFSDGIGDELRNALGKIPGFRVAARTSSHVWKGKSVPAPEVARQLAVEYVVEGSVRRAGDRVRIAVQLVAAADGFPVWSDTFERELRDVFAVQDEIAGLVARSLQLKLGTTVRSPSTEARTVEPEAFRLYLEGRQRQTQRTPEALDQGEELYRRALALDPAFPRAMGALASLLVLRGDLSYLQDGSWELAERLRVQADRLAREALELDPGEAEALVSQGMAAWARGDTPAAIGLVRAGLALNPSNAPAHHLLARILGANGELELSLRHMRQAQALDPLSPRIADNCALTMIFARRYEEALKLAERALSWVPDDPQIPAWRAWALEGLGRRDEAVEAARELAARGGSWVHYVACGILRRSGHLAEAEEIGARTAEGPVMSRVFCEAALGRAAGALALVPRPLGAMFFEELMYPPMWDEVRDTPAYARLLAELGLTEAHRRARSC